MVGALSDVGSVRKINEDYIGYFESRDRRIYVVADGMGGHNAGEKASEIAVNRTIETVKMDDSITDGRELLIKAIVLSNEEIYSMSIKNEELNGMGTTITACLMSNGKVFVANVGDSSGFLIRDSLLKITKDHSLVQELVDEGSITEAQARKHPSKNIITRALGTSPTVEVDIYELELKETDRIMLCTDGLTNELNTEEIYYYVNRGSDNAEACRNLIEEAKARGGRDNISVMIFGGECGDDRNTAE